VQYDSNEDLIQGMDALHAHVSDGQRRLFALIAEADRREAWQESGARDLAHWLSMRYGISQWKAHRWVAAANALPDLPRISEAFASGELGIDKVVELSRFATSDNESRLLLWAHGVSIGAIRRKADLVARKDLEEAREVARGRSLSWWYFDEGRRFGLEAELPAADGALVAKALGRARRGHPRDAGRRGPAVRRRATGGRAHRTVLLEDRRRPRSGSGDRGRARVLEGADRRGRL
jgi:Domain of unknown function (DUF222)